MGMTPLPGNPHVVLTEATRMITAAEKMREAARTLHAIGSEGALESEAIDELRKSAREVSTVMTHAAVRYQRTGDALREYAPALEAAQKQAKQAIAQLGGTDVDGARQAVHRADLDPWEHVTLSEEEKSQRAVDLANARAELADQERAAATARALWEDAHRDWEIAARTAAGRIDAGNDESKLDDGFWDNWNGVIDKYVAPVLQELVKALDQIADICGVIAAVLLLFGMPEFAAIFAIAAIALKGAVFLTTYVLVSLGKATWGDLLKAGLKFGLAVVTMGAGGAVAKLASKTRPKVVKDAIKEIVGYGFKYGPVTAQDPDGKYEVDLYKGLTDPGYREGLSAGDYAAELITLGLDPMGYIQDEGIDTAGDLVDDHVSVSGSLDFSDRATQDVSAIEVDFSGVDVDAIMGDNFGPGAGMPAHASLHSGTPGGGGGGGGW